MSIQPRLVNPRMMRTHTVSACLLVAHTLLSPLEGYGQSASSSETTKITMSRVVTMGDVEGNGNVGPITGLAMVGTDYWVMAKAQDPTQLSVFDASGRFVRTLGRSGAGPGEFNFAAYVISREDGFEVYDLGLQRMSRYNSKLEFVSSRRLPFALPRDIKPYDGGQLIVAATERTAELAGLPIHVVSANGRVVRSFGARGTTYRSTDDNTLRRAVAIGPDRAIWVASTGEQRIEKWDSTGQLITHFTRTSNWFQPSDTSSDGWISPESSVVGIQVDDAGRIWVLTRVPDRRWRSAVRRAPSRLRPGRTFQEVVDRSRYFDTIIEILDPVTGAVLASARADQLLSPFVGKGLSTEVVEDDDGVPYVVVWSLSAKET